MSKITILRLRLENPFEIMGICMFLYSLGFDVDKLHTFEKLNGAGMLRCAELNKWINIDMYHMTVHIECGNNSFEKEYEEAKNNEQYNQIFFKTVEELLNHLKTCLNR